MAGPGLRAVARPRRWSGSRVGVGAVGDALFGDQPADVPDARAELAGEGRDVYSVLKVSAAIGMVGGHDVVSILGTRCPRDDR